MKIGIAGAGLLGRLLAWQLSRAGHQVSLFDKDQRSGRHSAAYAAAAMLAPLSEAAACEPEIAEWGLLGLKRWPALLTALSADSGQSIDFKATGSIAVAHSLDKGSLLHFDEQLKAKLPDYPHQVQRLDRVSLGSLEPQLVEHFSSGILLREEGYLDNHALLTALDSACAAGGVEWFAEQNVQSVSAGLIQLEYESKRFDLAIDTRGVGAKKQCTGLRGVRGEILRVTAPEVSLSRPVRLMHPRYQLYISPRQGNRYVIGATEIESDSMGSVTVRSTMELLSALYSVHSGFAEATVDSAIAQLRPAYPDNLPQVSIEDGLLRVNGLYRHGYLLAPVVLAQCLKGLGQSTPELMEVA